jgi:HD-GYP domain-containing protein (c-di-GMP phosphodiesterase class II)
LAEDDREIETKVETKNQKRCLLMQNPDSAADSHLLNGDWKTALSKDALDSQDYLALPVQSLVPGQKVPFEVLVRTRVAGQAEDQLKSCCQPGERFDRDWLAKLQEAGVSRVYLHRQDQALALAYLNHHLPSILDSDSLPVKEKAERVADVTYIWLNQFFSNSQEQVGEKLKQGFTYVDTMLSLFRQDHYHRHWLLGLYRHDQSLYSHCLNTSLLGMSFGKHLGLPDQKIRDLGRGALLHDIGMTRVPAPILAKKGKLSDDEWELVKKHPYAGYIMLKTFSLMGREALLMVLQHHENGDGSGYPDGLTMVKIHPLARVMRLLDSFEALVSPRSWRSGHLPSQALWIMRQEWQQSGMYDVGLLAELIKFIAGDEQGETQG